MQDQNERKLTGVDHRLAETGDSVLAAIINLGQDVSGIKKTVDEMHQLIKTQNVEKVWYTTKELAEAMGVSVYTVAERWCNAGRIQCEKDPDNGKWLIPGSEFSRLVKGGGLKPTSR